MRANEQLQRFIVEASALQYCLPGIDNEELRKAVRDRLTGSEVFCCQVAVDKWMEGRRLVQSDSKPDSIDDIFFQAIIIVATPKDGDVEFVRTERIFITRLGHPPDDWDWLAYEYDLPHIVAARTLGATIVTKHERYASYAKDFDIPPPWIL